MTLETSTSFHLQGIWQLPGVCVHQVLAHPSERSGKLLKQRLIVTNVIAMLGFVMSGVVALTVFEVVEGKTGSWIIIDTLVVIFIILVTSFVYVWFTSIHVIPWLVRHFWYPVQSVLRIFGKAILLEEEEPLTLHLPVEVTLESDPVLVLRLKINTALGVLAVGEQVDGLEDDFKPDEGWPEDVSIKLDPLFCAIELSVNPDDPELLCLEVRDKDDAERCRFVLSPEDLGVTADELAHLPQIERAGLKLDTKARRKLLEALSSVADLQGIRLPALMRQVVVTR